MTCHNPDLTKKHQKHQESMSDPLEPILQYRMTKIQAKAFKLALTWQDLAHKMFPDCRIARLRLRGDPRQSLLFKLCLKLLNETQDLLELHEYRDYILAQLTVLKSYEHENPFVDPNILVGPKAWKRWKYWKYFYNKKQEKVVETQISSTQSHVIRDLQFTRKFLFNRFEGVPSKEEIQAAVNNGEMARWLSQNKVSAYYCLLSEWCKDFKSPMDLEVYRPSITREIERFFHIEFNYER